MGVDVNLYAVGPVTDEELEAANEFFRLRVYPLDTYEQEIGYGGLIREPAIPDNDPFADRFGGVPPWQEERIEWQTLSRYYGPGYERGDWPYIHNAVVCLRAALPQCTVYYGGDTTDFGIEATDELLAEYWAHWLGPEGRAYFDRMRQAASPLTGENRGKTENE